MKLIFMGTPEFAVPSIERLIRDGHQVAAVFTQPDKPAGRGKQLQPPPVKLFALDHGLPIYQPAKIKTNEEVRAVFSQIAPDACVVAAYGKILPEWLLKIPRLGCINVHASLLPKYRGAAPINWAIANGERETGITIMQMDAGMDTGPMLATATTEIGPEETAPELSARLARIGADLLSETLARIEQAGNRFAEGGSPSQSVEAIHPTPQDDRAATYAPVLKREDGLIDWRMTAQEITNRVRGFQPWPGTYTLFRGQRLIIWRARAAPFGPEFSEGGRPAQVMPATIINVDKAGATIACSGPTALHIEELQVEGKRKVPARDFVNGMRLKTGDRIADSPD